MCKKVVHFQVFLKIGYPDDWIEKDSHLWLGFLYINARSEREARSGRKKILCERLKKILDHLFENFWTTFLKIVSCENRYFPSRPE